MIPGRPTTATCTPPLRQSRIMSHRLDAKKTHARTASRFLPAGRSEGKVRAFRNARPCKLKPTGGLSVKLRRAAGGVLRAGMECAAWHRGSRF